MRQRLVLSVLLLSLAGVVFAAPKELTLFEKAMQLTETIERALKEPKDLTLKSVKTLRTQLKKLDTQLAHWQNILEPAHENHTK